MSKRSLSKLAGIQYAGEAGISRDCQDAVMRLIQFGNRIKNVRILSSFNSHCLLISIEEGDLVGVRSANPIFNPLGVVVTMPA